ncbi:MAG: TIGR03936 family radical SAM-associated protein [Acidimicrobiales bacterium]
MPRLRVRFTKLGKIRWTSHRDVARMWERAFRRLELPLAYTEGFSPRPKVSFGLALPTGHESLAEYLDMETTDGLLEVASLPARLSGALPSGLDVTAAAWIPPGSASLQESVTSCTWRWIAAPSASATSASATSASARAELASRVTGLLAAEEVVVDRIRKGQPYTDDIRQGVLALSVLGPVDPDPRSGVWLEATLTTQPRGLRPSEVLAALGSDLEERDVRRLHQWISRPGAWEEPLVAVGSPGATGDAPHAVERAS